MRDGSPITTPAIAARMIELAGIQQGDRVLEGMENPSGHWCPLKKAEAARQLGWLVKEWSSYVRSWARLRFPRALSRGPPCSSPSLLRTEPFSMW